MGITRVWRSQVSFFMLSCRAQAVHQSRTWLIGNCLHVPSCEWMRKGKGKIMLLCFAKVNHILRIEVIHNFQPCLLELKSVKDFQRAIFMLDGRSFKIGRQIILWTASLVSKVMYWIDLNPSRWPCMSKLDYFYLYQFPAMQHVYNRMQYTNLISSGVLHSRS